MEDYGDYFESVLRETDGMKQVNEIIELSRIGQKAMELDFVSARWVAAGAQLTDVSAVLEEYNPRLLIGPTEQRVQEYVSIINGEDEDSSESSAEEESSRRLQRNKDKVAYRNKEKRRKRRHYAAEKVPSALNFSPRIEDAFLKCLTYITLHADSGLGRDIRERARTYPRPALCRYLRRNPYTNYIFSTTTGNIFHAGSRHRNFDAANRRSNELDQFERQCVEEMLRILCEMPVASDMWQWVDHEISQRKLNGHTVDTVGLRIQFEHLGIHYYDPPEAIMASLSQLHARWQRSGMLYTSNGRYIQYNVFNQEDLDSVLNRENNPAPSIQQDGALARENEMVVRKLAEKSEQYNSILQGVRSAEGVQKMIDEILQNTEYNYEADPGNHLLAAGIILERANLMEKTVNELNKEKGMKEKKLKTLRTACDRRGVTLSKLTKDLESNTGGENRASRLRSQIKKEVEMYLIQKRDRETIWDELQVVIENLARYQKTYIELKVLHAQELLRAAQTQKNDFETKLGEIEDHDSMNIDFPVDSIKDSAMEAVAASLQLDKPSENPSHAATQRHGPMRRLGPVGTQVKVMDPPTTLDVDLDIQRSGSPTPSQSISVSMRPSSPSQASTVSDTVRNLVESGTRMSSAFARIVAGPQ